MFSGGEGMHFVVGSAFIDRRPFAEQWMEMIDAADRIIAKYP